MTESTITAREVQDEIESLEIRDSAKTAKLFGWKFLEPIHPGSLAARNDTGLSYLSLKPNAETEIDSNIFRFGGSQIQNADEDFVILKGDVRRPTIRRYVLSGTCSSAPPVFRARKLVGDSDRPRELVELLLTSDVVQPDPIPASSTEIDSDVSLDLMTLIASSEILPPEPISATSIAAIVAEKDPDTVLARLESAFRNSSEERFEVGMESTLSKAIQSAVLESGEEAVNSIGEIIRSEISSLPSRLEALRWIGLVEHSATKDCRANILCKFLKDPEVRIRDAALIGISDLNHADALPPLKDAFENEVSNMLKRNIGAVIAQLEKIIA